MFILKANAESGGGAGAGTGGGRLGRTPSSPTSAQGQFYAQGGRTSLTSGTRGRGQAIQYASTRGR
jgi:hypothetical protein